jgi:hypothetical protein
MMVRKTLTPPDMNPEGITQGDWVRKLNCKRVGFVVEINGSPPCALVDWFTGTKDLIGCIYLRRVPSGEGKDKRRA